MTQPVKSLKDIPELFIQERTETMGSTHKRTPEILDKIIQYIWHYQQTHNGETPKMVTIAKEIPAINEGSINYFIAMLVDQGRLNKISPRPFRATIIDTPENTQAIARFKRLLAIKERDEAAERDRIRAAQERTAISSQVEADKAAVNEAFVDAATPVKAPPAEAVVDGVAEAATNFLSAKQSVRTATRDLRTAMPQLVKLAETRDLMLELIERGYSVSKK